MHILCRSVLEKAVSIGGRGSKVFQGTFGSHIAVTAAMAGAFLHALGMAGQVSKTICYHI